MSDKSKKIMVMAGEISGDLYGYPLLVEIKKRYPDFEICGVGGPKMKSAGMSLFYDSSSWGTIGLIEAFKKLPYLYFVYYDVSKKLREIKPDLLVLIDYPGFNMRLCRYAKKLGIPTLYYFPPSKWSYNPEDVIDAARNITKVVAPFKHTADVYKKAGADVEFVGNPLLEIVKPSMPVEELKKKYNITKEEKIISLLPGSRSMEVKYMLPMLVKTAGLILQKMPNARFIMPISSSTISRGTGITMDYIKHQVSLGNAKIDIELDTTYDIFAISDFSIITSGTATLEAACMGLPMAIIYKVSFLTELFARSITKLPEYFGLPNLILNREIVPELIQHNFSPEIVCDKVVEILNSPEKIADIKNNLGEVIKTLGGPGATARVSELILKMVEKTNER